MIIRKIILVASLVLLLIATDHQHSWAVTVSVQEPVILKLFKKATSSTNNLEKNAQEALNQITMEQAEKTEN